MPNSSPVEISSESLPQSHGRDQKWENVCKWGTFCDNDQNSPSHVPSLSILQVARIYESGRVLNHVLLMSSSRISSFSMGER